MRWTTVRALCRRLTVAAVTLTMVTGSLPAGAFAETLTTDGTFVQTDNDQAADADAADPDKVKLLLFAIHVASPFVLVAIPLL